MFELHHSCLERLTTNNAFNLVTARAASMPVRTLRSFAIDPAAPDHLALTGSIDARLPIASAALNAVEESGQRYYEAETYRFKGELHVLVDSL